MIEVPTSYRLRIVKNLLMQAHILGIQSDDLVEFLGTQIQAMIVCRPNIIRPFNRIWLLRGFYPGTTLFFKLSVIDKPNELRKAKASALSIRSSANRYDDYIDLNGCDVNNLINDRMENILLEAGHSARLPLIKSMKMPRCMSPKGMKLLTYKKPKKRTCDVKK